VATTTDESIPRRLRVPLNVFQAVEAVRGHRSFNAFTCRALELYALQEAQALAGGRPPLTLIHPVPPTPLRPVDPTSTERVPMVSETSPLTKGDRAQSSVASGEQEDLGIDEPRRRQPPRSREEWGTPA
jgi:hypothetical protein